MKNASTLKVVSVALLSLALAACVSQGKYKKEEAQVNNLTAVNKQLTGELDSANATIKQLQDELKVTLVDSVLFDEGSAKLHKTGEKELSRIAPTLAALKGPRVVVRAFTDNIPIKHRSKVYHTNLDLSSARADVVADFLMKKGVPQAILSAQGFGESLPIASNDTPAGRKQNRRVELVITYMPVTP